MNTNKKSINNSKQSFKGKIILAEDDKFIARAYLDGLKRAGYTVIPSFDGQDTLEKIRQEQPDIVLLDIIMPKKNGFEVLEELKEDDKLKQIPVVILSNLGQETDVQQGMKSGAIDYLIKSDCSMDEVIEKVESVLSKKIT